MVTTSIQSGTHAHRDGSDSAQHAGAVRNLILSLLPDNELEPIIARCQPTTIESKQVVYRREEAIGHVYFPENSVISLITELEDGDAVEAMTVGCDGFVGLALFHGVAETNLK